MHFDIIAKEFTTVLIIFKKKKQKTTEQKDEALVRFFKSFSIV